MTFEVKEYLDYIKQYLMNTSETTDEISVKDRFIRTFLGIVYADTMQTEYKTSLDIQDVVCRFQDKDLDEFVHTFLEIPIKDDRIVDVDRIAIKRFLVDTLTLIDTPIKKHGYTEESKYLTMSESSRARANCHITKADLLETDENTVDRVFNGFDLELVSTGEIQALEDRLIKLAETLEEEQYYGYCDCEREYRVSSETLEKVKEIFPDFNQEATQIISEESFDDLYRTLYNKLYNRLGEDKVFQYNFIYRHMEYKDKLKICIPNYLPYNYIMQRCSNELKYTLDNVCTSIVNLAKVFKGEYER